MEEHQIGINNQANLVPLPTIMGNNLMGGSLPSIHQGSHSWETVQRIELLLQDDDTDADAIEEFMDTELQLVLDGTRNLSPNDPRAATQTKRRYYKTYSLIYLSNACYAQYLD